MEVMVPKSILKRSNRKSKEKIDMKPSKIPKMVHENTRHCLTDSIFPSIKTHHRRNIKIMHKKPIVVNEKKQNTSKDEVPEAFDIIKESQGYNKRVCQIMKSSPLKTLQNENVATSNTIYKSKVSFKDVIATSGNKKLSRFRLDREVELLKAQNKLFDGESKEESRDKSKTLNIEMQDKEEIKNGTDKNDQIDRIDKTMRKSFRFETKDEWRHVSQENKIADNKKRLRKTKSFEVRYNLRDRTSIDVQNQIFADESDKEDFTKLIFQTKNALFHKKDTSLEEIKGSLKQNKHLNVNEKNIQNLRDDSASIAFTDNNETSSKLKRVNSKCNSNKTVTSAMQGADENVVKEKETRTSEDDKTMQWANTDEPTEAETQSSDAKLDKAEKRLTMFKSNDTPAFVPDVTKSAIQTRMIIDIPSNGKVVQVDCLANYASMHSNYQPVVGSNSNVLFSKGLNIAMGSISSGIVQINANSCKEMQTPKRHHLIFCMMTGTVIITICDVNKRITTGDHFFIPCNLSYNIRNVGMKRAVLSVFKIMDGCFDLAGST